MKRLRSPIPWTGGKRPALKDILPHIPIHHTYVEVFGGSAQVLFAKPPSPVEVYNDTHSGVVNFFRVLRNPEQFREFLRLVSLTPFSREEYEFCKKTWHDCTDSVERAYRWFVVARQSYHGRFGKAFSYSIRHSVRGMAKNVSAYLSSIDLLPEVHERIMRVIIEHDDFRRIIPRYDTPETFFYCDPPYVPGTYSGRLYQYEMTIEDHQDLVKILLNIKGMALLSGIPNPVYEPLELAGWKRVDKVVQAKLWKRATRLYKDSPKETRIDSLWISPNALAKLQNPP